MRQDAGRRRNPKGGSPMRIVRRLGQFVQKIASGLRAADQRFVQECLLGLTRRGSTMLTEIGRGLKERCALKHTEKRLSRMAGTEHFDDERLRANYLSEVGRLTERQLPYVAVDLSDIAKPNGKTMEALCRVRDGSSRRERMTTGSRRRKPGRRTRSGSPQKVASTRREAKVRVEKAAELVPGYLVFEAVATHPEQHHVLPMMTEVFSTETPEFKSQNDEIDSRLRVLAPHVSPKAVWLFDRGFDGGYILKTLIDLKLQWVVRILGTRNVEFAKGPKRMDVLADGLVLPHSVRVRTRTKGSRDVERLVHFTSIPVHLHGVEGQRGLIVASLGRHKRMMLLCWRVPRSPEEAAQLLRAYLRRWSVEDSGRACKQLVGIEDVRVQSLRAISRLVRLAGMALGWLCLLLLFARKTVAEILSRAKTVGREPLLLLYRLLEGIRHPA